MANGSVQLFVHSSGQSVVGYIGATWRIRLNLCLLRPNLRPQPTQQMDWSSHFWATVCKTVRPMLSDHCLSVYNVGVLRQTVGWIRMPFGTEVGLSPGHIVLDGHPAPPKGYSPQFLAHVYCGQTAGWIKMPHGTELGLSPGHIVLDGHPAPPPPQKGHSSPPRLFGPCLLWLNG